MRYPLSGLVGTPAAAAASAAHNAQFPNDNENLDLLNQNVMAWLKGDKPTPKDPDPDANGAAARRWRLQGRWRRRGWRQRCRARPLCPPG